MDVLNDAWIYFETVFPTKLTAVEPEVWVGIVVAVVLVFLAVLLKLCFGGGSKGKYVCLLGLSDSGKTLLFTRLMYGIFMRTQTSIKENKTVYEPATTKKKKGKPVELVDIPGDERVRERLFSKYKDSLHAIVVVIDSVNYQQDVRNVAELTFDLLTDKAVCKRRVPILFACNKQDLSLAKTCDVIQTQLEKEITILRLSRAAKLAALDGPRGKAQVSMAFLGKKGKDFEFSDLPWRVEFVGCSAKGRGEEESSVADVEAIKAWIEKHC